MKTFIIAALMAASTSSNALIVVGSNQALIPIEQAGGPIPETPAASPNSESQSTPSVAPREPVPAITEPSEQARSLTIRGHPMSIPADGDPRRSAILISASRQAEATLPPAFLFTNLRSGDIVLAINGKPTATETEFRRALTGTGYLTIDMIRDGKEQTIFVPRVPKW
jgi:hypothetical protein